MDVPVAAPESRILTLPNLSTLARLPSLPVFLWLLFGKEDRVAVGGLLALLRIGD